MIPAQLLSTYSEIPPTITLISPATGTNAGGTAVSITGKGFLTAKTLTFGGSSIGSFTIVSDSLITFTSPAHANGTVNASIVTDQGSVTGGTFEYFTAGSTTFDSGSGNYTVPVYGTLTIELWGGGGPAGVGATVGTAGGASTVSTYSLSAGGGAVKNAANLTAGAGGTASGGNTTNTNGTAGTNGSVLGGLGPWHGFNGANAPGGGGTGGTGATKPQPFNTNTDRGTDGGAPGAGAGGSVTGNPVGGGTVTGQPSGSSGAYVRHVFTFGAPGAPAAGALIAYAVGVAGLSDNNATMANGGAGRIKFTVS